eukprot:jgi/Botrbrau1/20673/Bobra.0058s0007.1
MTAINILSMVTQTCPNKKYSIMSKRGSLQMSSATKDNKQPNRIRRLRAVRNAYRKMITTRTPQMAEPTTLILLRKDG